jgi:hypothetical protein
MHTITKRIPKLAGLAFIAFSAACSSDRVAGNATADAANAVTLAAPALPSVVAKNATVAAEAEAPKGDLRHSTLAAIYPAGAVTYQFTVNPTVSQSFIIGTHMVAFPAYTICDPSASGYGPNLWLSTCPKLTQPITITATTWIDALGRAQIDFDNAIRFYPNYSGQLPAIYLRDPWAAASKMGRIDYCSAVNVCVNEAATDSALATQRDMITGYLFRLVRHFSGYNVWA